MRNNSGALVSSIVAGQVSDADAGAVAGIAVTAVDNSNGTWQYSTNGGANWLNFSGLSANSALLLAADAFTRVRFVPNAYWSGTVAGGITFYAWDQTSGAAGTQADATGGGGSSAFSVASASAGIAVTDVNQAPQGTDGAVTLIQNTTYQFVASDFGFSDPNDTPSNGLAAVRITSLPTSGTLSNNGVAVSIGQFISVADINAGLLTFTPAVNASGNNYTSFTFQVQDDGGTANGATDIDQSPNQLTINIARVNNAPSGTSGSVSTIENTPYAFSPSNFGFSDAIDTPFDQLLAVQITTLPTTGTLTVGGAAVSAGQFVTAASINLGQLVFTPAANTYGANYATFTFQVQDNGGTANGGVDLDPTPKTLTIDVARVNDAPTGTNGNVSASENTAYVFTAANFGFSDPSDTPPDQLLAVQITSLPTAGTLTVGGAAVTAGQVVSAAAINAGQLVFTPTANSFGVGYATFTFQVQDNGGTANGGVDLNPAPKSMTIDVAAVVVPAAPSDFQPPTVAPAPVVTTTPTTTAPSTPTALPTASAPPPASSVPTTAGLAAPAPIARLEAPDTFTAVAIPTPAAAQLAPRHDRELLGAHRDADEMDRQPSKPSALQVARADRGERTMPLEHFAEGNPLWNDLDEFKEQMESLLDSGQLAIGSAVTVTTGLTVGYVLWIVRGGLLLSSIVAQMPAWRLIDPLVVLGRVDKDLFDDSDDESLDSMLSASEDAPTEVAIA